MVSWTMNGTVSNIREAVGDEEGNTNVKIPALQSERDDESRDEQEDN